jgi:hypothetical protein
VEVVNRLHGRVLESRLSNKSLRRCDQSVDITKRIQVLVPIEDDVKVANERHDSVNVEAAD